MAALRALQSRADSWAGVPPSLSPPQSPTSGPPFVRLHLEQGRLHLLLAEVALTRGPGRGEGPLRSPFYREPHEWAGVHGLSLLKGFQGQSRKRLQGSITQAPMRKQAMYID